MLQRRGASPRNRRTLRSIWGSHRAARHDSQFIITLLCLILILCESFTRWSFHSGTADIRGGDAKVTWLRLLRSQHLRAKQTGFYRNRLNICSSWNYRDTNRKSFRIKTISRQRAAHTEPGLVWSGEKTRWRSFRRRSETTTQIPKTPTQNSQETDTSTEKPTTLPTTSQKPKREEH